MMQSTALPKTANYKGGNDDDLFKNPDTQDILTLFAQRIDKAVSLQELANLAKERHDVTEQYMNREITRKKALQLSEGKEDN